MARLTEGGRAYIQPFLPIGGCGPRPTRLRQQSEGVIRRFRTGAQWRETPAGFGAWPAAHTRFRQWRGAGVFDTLPEGLTTTAAQRGRSRGGRTGKVHIAAERGCCPLVLTPTAGQAGDSPRSPASWSPPWTTSPSYSPEGSGRDHEPAPDSWTG